MGMVRDESEVASMRITAVLMACVTPAVQAAAPTTAYPALRMFLSGKISATTSPTTRPSSAPRTRVGTNTPAGMGDVTEHSVKINCHRESLKQPQNETPC